MTYGCLWTVLWVLGLRGGMAMPWPPTLPLFLAFGEREATYSSASQ